MDQFLVKLSKPVHRKIHPKSNCSVPTSRPTVTSKVKNLTHQTRIFNNCLFALQMNGRSCLENGRQEEVMIRIFMYLSTINPYLSFHKKMRIILCGIEY